MTLQRCLGLAPLGARRGILAGLGLLAALSAPLHAADLPVAPDLAAAGFAPARLDRVRSLLDDAVARGDYAGATWVVLRDGEIVSRGASGYRNLEARIPMTEDTVFAIASMTKILTSVTALTLLEEGRFNLDDPVSDHLPEFKHLQVFVGGTADAPELVPAKKVLTIRHLLTHCSGFTYGGFEGDPWRTLYERAGLWQAASLRDFAARAARLPLKHEPGEGWTYGINTDLLGALIEQVSGQPLGEAMRTRVFEPLGMTSTSLGHRPDLDLRLAQLYERRPDGLVPIANPLEEMLGHVPSGGAGAFSTAGDYARFAQMLANGGRLDEVRVLGRKTVELMTSKQVLGVDPAVSNRWAPPGFGLGVRIRLASERGESLGSAGMYGWEGYTSTLVRVDPEERIVLVLLLQHRPYNDRGIFEKFTNTVYQALAD